MPDHEATTIAIALDTLDPALSALADVLDSHDVPRVVVAQVFAAVAEAYAAGHADGARHAVAEIAPAAARHGLQLRLGPRLQAPSWPTTTRCTGATREVRRHDW